MVWLDATSPRGLVELGANQTLRERFALSLMSIDYGFFKMCQVT